MKQSRSLLSSPVSLQYRFVKIVITNRFYYLLRCKGHGSFFREWPKPPRPQSREECLLLLCVSSSQDNTWEATSTGRMYDLPLLYRNITKPHSCIHRTMFIVHDCYKQTQRPHTNIDPLYTRSDEEYGSPEELSHHHFLLLAALSLLSNSSRWWWWWWWEGDRVRP